MILYPKLVISGRVTDAETGRPVPAFRIVQGRRIERADRYAGRRTPAADVAGVSTVPVREPRAALFVRVEAPGYKPAQSRAFLPTEGSQSFDFALQGAAGSPGSSCSRMASRRRESRSPLAKATQSQYRVPAVGPVGSRWEFPKSHDRGRTDDSRSHRADGQIPTRRHVCQAGYADAPSDEFAKSGKLVLQPWGQIEGGVRIGPRSGSDQQVMFVPIRRQGKGGCLTSSTVTRHGATSADASGLTA